MFPRLVFLLAAVPAGTLAGGPCFLLVNSTVHFAPRKGCRLRACLESKPSPYLLTNGWMTHVLRPTASGGGLENPVARAVGMGEGELGTAIPILVWKGWLGPCHRETSRGQPSCRVFTPVAEVSLVRPSSLSFSKPPGTGAGHGKLFLGRKVEYVTGLIVGRAETISVPP